MSLENSNNKDKAVVMEEEVSPAMLVEAVPLAVSEPVILESTAQHQTPLNSFGRDNKRKNQGPHGRSVREEVVGSSSSVPSKPATEGEPVEAVPLAMASPAILAVSHHQQRGDSRNVLIRDIMQHCVAALATGNIVAANAALLSMSRLASAGGDPMQRVAYVFAEALGRRALLEPLRGLSWALQQQLPRPPTPAYTDKARHWFNELCPLLRVAASAANRAILAAMEAENHVHVVDLGGASPNQWLDLLRLFAARPQGAPSLRLTVVNEHEDFISIAAALLTQEAVRLHVPFVFNPVRSHIDRFSTPGVAALGVERGQALAITCTLQLHRLIADVTTIELPLPATGHGKKGKGKRKTPEQHTAAPHQTTKADALLRVLHDLSPKLMVLTEQEADHNGVVLWDRVRNAFDYYAVLFNDLEVGGAPRNSTDRAAVEQLLLREEIIDIVARDGALRRERHEKMVRWAGRMRVAGFEAAQVSSGAFVETARLAHELSGDGSLREYRVMEDNGYFIVYSRMNPMFSVTTWQPARRISE